MVALVPVLITYATVCAQSTHGSVATRYEESAHSLRSAKLMKGKREANKRQEGKRRMRDGS